MIESLTFPVAELATIAVLTEGFVEIIKGVTTKQLTEQGKQIISMAISVICCTALHVSIFTNTSELGIIFGCILAGIISSRGSNFIHDLIDGVNAVTRKK